MSEKPAKDERRMKDHNRPSPFALRASSPIGAAILAGGASRRMGQNKALLRRSPDGSSLIEIVVSRLSGAGFPSPMLVTNSPEEYAFLGLETLPDDDPGSGPIGGILTALRHSPYERVLVVGCDMPFLNADLLGYMATKSPGYEALAPVWNDVSGARRVEPLHTIYSKKCIPIIERRVEEGRLKAGDLLDALDTTYLSEGEIRQHDPRLLSFRNVNTPEDWERMLLTYE